MRSGWHPSIESGPIELEVERVEVGAEQLGQHLGCGAELGVAVFVGLHDRGVHAERHVVHEDAAVDPAEIDPALVAVGERVERADDVVAVDAEIEGEVIPGTGGDAHKGNVVFRRHPGNQCLRPVASGHTDDVGAPRRTHHGPASRGRRPPSVTVSMPLACAAAANSGLAFPPPECGFMDQHRSVRRGRPARPAGELPRSADGWRAWRHGRSRRSPATRTITATMSSTAWLRRKRVTNARMTAASAMHEARSRMTPRRGDDVPGCRGQPPRSRPVRRAAPASCSRARPPHDDDRRQCAEQCGDRTELDALPARASWPSARVSRRRPPAGPPGCGRGRCRGRRPGGGLRGVRSR